MRKPAKIGLGVFGSIVAIIVIAGIANGGDPAPVPAAAPATSTAAATPTPPTATPPPTTAAAPPADELFVAAVVDSRELVGVGRSICGAIGTPDVSHASLVAELGASKWGAAIAEAVVASAEQNLCPERQYVVPPAPSTVAAPAPPAPQAAPKPEPKRERAPRSEPAAAPRDEAPSSAYYKNCAAARAAGAAPLRVGEPGYRGALDRDKDGTACE
jgi:hypothetical protein